MLDKRIIFSKRQDPLQWLRQEFERRRKRNPAYSSRRYADQLGISSGRLSEILLGKRRLTANVGRQIAEQMGFSAAETAFFLEAIQESYVREDLASARTEYQELATEYFSAISQWWHMALLNLVTLEDCRRAKPARLAKRLGISEDDAQDALSRLVSLGMLEWKDDSWHVHAGAMKTTEDVPSDVIRTAHREYLRLADQALDRYGVEEREFTCLSLPSHPDLVPQAKDLIRRFRDDLVGLLRTSEKNHEVYCCNVQFFPLTRK